MRFLFCDLMHRHSFRFKLDHLDFATAVMPGDRFSFLRTSAVGPLGGLSALAFALDAAECCQLSGDLLLHTDCFVLLVGCAEQMQRDLGLQR